MEATEARALEALNKLIKYNRNVNHNLYVDRDLLDITIKINELVVDNSRMREQLRKLANEFRRSVLTAGLFC